MACRDLAACALLLLGFYCVPVRKRVSVAKEERVTPDTGGNPANGASPEALQALPGDSTREKITKKLENLTGTK